MNFYTKAITGLGIGIALIAGAIFLIGCTGSADPYNLLSQSVVRVYTPGVGGGTGFLLADQGKLVTISNWHVCDLSKDGTMSIARDLEFEDVKVKILKTDPLHDLCALQAVPGKALRIGGKTKSFAAVYLLGHPYLRHQTPAQGRHVGPRKDMFMIPAPKNGCPQGFLPTFDVDGIYCAHEFFLDDVTANVFPGNSGSPVVTEDGFLAGVVNGQDTSTNQATVIRLEDVQNFVRSL